MPIPLSNELGDRSDPAESETTGLRGLRSWRAIYLVVTVIFLILVALLYTLSKAFS
jgi:hypothetical protein